MELNSFLSKLKKVKKINFSEYTACCPAHEDKNPSLSISEKDGKILLHCHRGCKPEEIVSAMGLTMKELFGGSSVCKAPRKSKLRCHIYCGRDGLVVARKNIFAKPDGGKYATWERYEKGSFIKGLGKVKPPIYRLPELMDSKGSVYIVEGEKDVDTMYGLGYTATTSPKGAGGRWEREYTDCISGREIVIISDNDEPGRKAAENIINAIKSDVKAIRYLPSEVIYPSVKHKGDISDIMAEVGAEKTKELITEAYNNAEVIKYDPMPPYFYYGKGGILRVDRPTLAAYIRKNEHYLFELGEEDRIVRRLWYKDGIYQPISLEEIRALVKRYITDYNESCLFMADVDEVIRNILSDPYFVRSDELDADEGIVNFKNGILRLEDFKLTPHSPDIYSTVQLDCEWDQKAVDTPVFNKFMSELCDEQSGRIRFLMEFIGVTLSNIKGYRMKSALFMVGEGNTGKSQLKALCERILGQRNCAAIDLNTLEARFGTSAIYGKRLAGSSDLSYMSVNELKIFKQVTGGDRIFAERKGSSPFYYTYNGQLWFCMNKLPKFGGDRGDWVYDRINIIECNNVIPPERRDKFICDKMYAERSGIVLKAFMMLREVIKNGYEYTVCPEFVGTRLIYQKENNPVANFYKQCCIPRSAETPRDGLTTTAMHKVFVRWCQDNEKGYKCSYTEFKQELCKLLKTTEEKIIIRTNKGRMFNFRLNHDAFDVYYYPYI